MMMEQQENRQRLYYLDYLRALSAFAVVVIHVCNQHFNDTDIASSQWMAINVYDSLSRFAVPVFVMISGALFLSPEKEISLKKLYTKHILRLAIAFVFWSALYAAIGAESLLGFLRRWISGPTHFWYIFMMIGIYIAVPLLRRIAEKPKLIRYYLAVWFVFSFVVPNALKIYPVETLQDVFDKAKLHFFLGYAGYYLLGYLLTKTVIKKPYRIMIYVFGLCALAATIGGTWFLSHRSGEAFESLYSNFSINVLLQAVAAFVLLKTILEKKSIHNDAKGYRLIKLIGNTGFGIYLCHVLVISLVEKYLHLSAVSFHPLLSIPVLSITAFLLSFAVSVCLKKIPVINRYII